MKIYNNVPDTKLWEAFVEEQNNNAFAALIERRQMKIWLIIINRTGCSMAMATDALQSLICKWLESSPKLKEIKYPINYIARCASNDINGRKKRKALRIVAQSDEHLNIAAATAFNGESEEERENAYNQASAKFVHDVHECINSMKRSSVRQQVLRMNIFEDMEYLEISEKLNISSSKAADALSRGKSRLKNLLKELGWRGNGLDDFNLEHE